MRLAAKFPLGRLAATPGALEALGASGQWPGFFLARHRAGDWGDVGAADSRANAEALRHGGRLFSAYTTRRGVRLWVITEADRGRTVLLLPEDY